MLSHEQNELICRVGPGTPMGRLMREYWVPALPSLEFPGPDSLPKRMRLLGENLVMFRDSAGRMGALEEHCPHRGASLYFGRNEEGGIRCAYHGWKFDIHGQCMEAPTEQPERRERFCANMKARAYPCHEAGHMVWVYMGPRSAPPPFPAFEVNTLPPERVGQPTLMMEQANYLQNMEGDLDSAHLDWLHRRLKEDSPAPAQGMRGFWNPTGLPPVLDVTPTNYGAYYTAKRRLPDGQDWHRINQFIFPFHTMISSGDGSVNLRSFVPIDDYNALIVHQGAWPVGEVPPRASMDSAAVFAPVGGFVERSSDPRSYFLTQANRSNDYNRDLEMQRTTMFIGIPFVGNLPDRAMTEPMTNSRGEPIYDRSKEHLSASDMMVVTVRRQLINAVKRYESDGVLPDNVLDSDLARVRSASLRMPADADWRAISAPARVVVEGTPSAADLGLIV